MLEVPGGYVTIFWVYICRYLLQQPALPQLLVQNLIGYVLNGCSVTGSSSKMCYIF